MELKNLNVNVMIDSMVKDVRSSFRFNAKVIPAVKMVLTHSAVQMAEFAVMRILFSMSLTPMNASVFVVTISQV